MDRRAAAPFDHEARRVEGVRDDSRMRLELTMGAAIGCAIILVLLSGVFDSDQLRFTKDLYGILYAMNNVTNLAYVPFNYSRVLNDTAMQVLLLDILPEVKEVNAVDAIPYLLTICGGVGLGLSLLTIVGSAMGNDDEARGEDPSPEVSRAAWTYVFGTGAFWFAALLAWLYLSLAVWKAIPVSSELDWKKPSKYAVQQKRFIALLGLTLASVILLCLLLGAAASPEIYFVLAIQRLRGLVEHGVSSEYMLAPELQAKLKSDVLPYVSQAYIDLNPTPLTNLLHILASLLTILSLLPPFYTTPSSPTFRRDILALAAGITTCIFLVSLPIIPHTHPPVQGSWLQTLHLIYALFALAAIPAVVGLVGDAVSWQREYSVVHCGEGGDGSERLRSEEGREDLEMGSSVEEWEEVGYRGSGGVRTREREVAELLCAMHGFPVSTADYEGDEESLFPAADADTIPARFSRLRLLRSSEVSLWPGIRYPSHEFAPSQHARGPGSNDEDSVRDTQSSVVTVAAAGADGEGANIGINDIGVEAIEGDGISSAEEGDDEGDGGREELSMGADVDVKFMEECLEEWRRRRGNERWRVWEL